MILRNQRTVLRTIGANDIEQVRIWRNLNVVNRYLSSSGYISKDAQQKWFSSLDYSASIYFMMEESGVPFGMIYANKIDMKDKSFWGSIFVGDEGFANTHLPVKAVMMLFVFFF